MFVVINNDNEIIPLDYFGFIISSHIEKVKNKSKFKYNEPLLSSVTNGLKVDSIVKCDKIYKFSKNNIVFKIGNVSVNDFLRFVNAYSKYLKVIDNKSNLKIKN